MSLTCRDFVEFLHTYLDGELPPEQKRVFEVHMDLCPACVHYVETYEQTAKLTGKCAELERNGPPGDMPEALVQAILAARHKG